MGSGWLTDRSPSLLRRLTPSGVQYHCSDVVSSVRYAVATLTLCVPATIGVRDRRINWKYLFDSLVNTLLPSGYTRSFT